MVKRNIADFYPVAGYIIVKAAENRAAGNQPRRFPVAPLFRTLQIPGFITAGKNQR